MEETGRVVKTTEEIGIVEFEGSGKCGHCGAKIGDRLSIEASPGVSGFIAFLLNANRLRRVRI